jgi:hypothetical protein
VESCVATTTGLCGGADLLAEEQRCSVKVVGSWRVGHLQPTLELREFVLRVDGVTLPSGDGCSCVVYLGEKSAIIKIGEFKTRLLEHRHPGATTTYDRYQRTWHC